MPNQATLKRARKDQAEGKSVTTQAGEFVKETIDEMRAGKIGARSTKQAIAIGLSKARRAGIDLPPPRKGKTSEKTRQSAESSYRAGQQDPDRPVNPNRSKASTRALKREGHEAVSAESLSRQGKSAARKRTAAQRSASARKGAQTRLAHQSAADRKASARKAARTRKANAGK